MCLYFRILAFKHMCSLYKHGLHKQLHAILLSIFLFMLINVFVTSLIVFAYLKIISAFRFLPQALIFCRKSYTPQSATTTKNRKQRLLQVYTT